MSNGRFITTDKIEQALARVRVIVCSFCRSTEVEQETLTCRGCGTTMARNYSNTYKRKQAKPK